MKKRYIEISQLPNFEITCSDGKRYVLLPFEHLYDIPEAEVVEPVKCKDCSWYVPYKKPVEDFDGRCLARLCETDEEEYCSYSTKQPIKIYF